MEIYKRPSPPPSHPPYLVGPESPTTDNRHMHERQLLSPGKRQRSEPSQPDKTSLPISKKQRLNHRSGFQTPPAYWDTLSKVWLTKRALKELDRRNTQAPLNPRLPQGAHRPVTGNFLAKPKRSCQTAQYTVDYLRDCEPRILKSIKLFARHGGPDLSDLRNYPEPIHSPDHTMSSGRKRGSAATSSQQGGSTAISSQQGGSAATSSTKPTTNTLNTKSTGTYDRTFQQKLIDNDVYPHGYEYPDGRVPSKPNNWKDINHTLTQARPSLSPSKFTDEDFERFVRADAKASKEKQVSESVIPIIEGKIVDLNCRSGGIPFTNLRDLVNSDPLAERTLKPGNPDIYYGARPEQLSRRVRDELSDQIIPSTQDNLPMAPNFFVAAKGPDGSLAVAGRQACYDGALGARGMHSLRSYGQDETVYDNNAYTMTSTYHGGTLKMYTSHVAPPRSPGVRPQYHMTQMRSFAITDTRDTCVAGLQAYRNGRDWTEKQRNEAMKQANERATPVEATAETEAFTMSQESQTSLNDVSNTQMHSLRSYGQDEPVYNNNAYTITSIYHGGTLKMYTSHVAPPRSPGGRPEYHMSQINTWGMTGNADTFRQGARAYRNARDWAKEQRDEAISQANERANPVEATAETEAFTVSQESQTSLNDTSNTREDSGESDTSIEEVVYHKLPTKRSSRHSKCSETQQKRRITEDSSGTGRNEG